MRQAGLLCAYEVVLVARRLPLAVYLIYGPQGSDSEHEVVTGHNMLQQAWGI